MKGMPFGKKPERIEVFEQVMVARLAQSDQQVLTEILRDYYTDEQCWAWRDSDNHLCCHWCNASGIDAVHLRHALNCPMGWLQAKIEFVEDRLFSLPRLRIGRPQRHTKQIPEEKLLPGSIEEYVDGPQRQSHGSRARQ